MWPLAPLLTRGATSAQLAAHPTPLFALGQGAILLFTFGAATWIVGVRALGLDAAALRWSTRLPWLRGFGIGVALGILPAAVAMTMGVFAAGAGWSYDGARSPAGSRRRGRPC